MGVEKGGGSLSLGGSFGEDAVDLFFVENGHFLEALDDNRTLVVVHSVEAKASVRR